MPGIFLRTFAVVFLAEMGDKSQFLMAALTAEYRLRDIFAGTLAAIAVLCGLAVSLGALVGELLPMPLVSSVAGGAFLFFAWSGIGGEEEEGGGAVRRGRVFPAIFGTYFLAELGDKTQLATLALSAENSRAMPAVFLGATAALFLSGALGAGVGVLLGRHLPARLFRAASFVIFAACGTVKLLDGAERLMPTVWAIVTVSVILMIFVFLCALTVRRRGRVHDTAGEQSVSVQRQQQALSDL